MENEEKITKVLDLIFDYGGIDGSHHKQWVIDQIVRLLVDDYGKWVSDFQDGEDGEDTYEWEVGIAP